MSWAALPAPVEFVGWLCECLLVCLGILIAPFMVIVAGATVLVLAGYVLFAVTCAVIWVLERVGTAWERLRGPRPEPPRRELGDLQPSVWAVLEPRGWRGHHLQLTAARNRREDAEAILAQAPDGSRLVRMYREAPPDLYVVPQPHGPVDERDWSPPEDVEDMF